MPLKYFLILILFSFCYKSFAQNIQYELQSIEFRGNEEIPASVLSDIIYSKETPGWFWQFLDSFTPFGSEAVYFDSSDIERDLAALNAFYKANGFFQATFSYGYDVDSSTHEVDLFYNINENTDTKYGKISFIGLDSIPYGIYEDLETDLTLDSNSRYMESVVQQNIDNFIGILLNSGYPFARFDSTLITIDTTTNYADVDIYFSPDELYNLDTVFVKLEGEGASGVKEDEIRDITGLDKDEPYSLEEIRIAQRRLSRTGLFNSLKIATIDSAAQGSRIPLLINGNVGLLNELSPEIILNNEQNALNIGSGASYIRKNFFGGARRFTAKASFGLQDFFNVDFENLVRNFSFRDTTLLGYLDARIIIEQPYMFREPVHGILENYLTIEKQNNFNDTRYGSKITFDFELPHYTFVNSFSTYYNLEESKEVFRNNRDSLSIKLLSLIGFDIGKTTSDNLLFPTEGYSVTAQIEEANALPYLVSKISNSSYSGSLFYRILLNSAYYLALDQPRNLIFGIKFKGGHMQAYYGDYAGLPINKTFYGGGSNSVRGWRSNELRPQGTPRIEGFQGINYKGGTFLVEGSTEIRYRFIENIGTALFFDYGNVWLSYNDFRFDEVALAAGIGLRYYTQVAPFRIDFGFKFYDPFDKKFIWDNWKPGFFNNLEFHFGIGEAF